jgi:hypothetical protein
VEFYCIGIRENSDFEPELATHHVDLVNCRTMIIALLFSKREKTKRLGSSGADHNNTRTFVFLFYLAGDLGKAGSGLVCVI